MKARSKYISSMLFRAGDFKHGSGITVCAAGSLNYQNERYIISNNNKKLLTLFFKKNICLNSYPLPTFIYDKKKDCLVSALTLQNQIMFIEEVDTESADYIDVVSKYRAI